MFEASHTNHDKNPRLTGGQFPDPGVAAVVGGAAFVSTTPNGSTGHLRVPCQGGEVRPGLTVHI